MWTLARRLRRQAMAAAMATGVIALLLPAVPGARHFLLLVMGFSGYWPLGVFLVSSIAARTSCPEEDTSAGGAAEKMGGRSISLLDRMVLFSTPLVLGLFLFGGLKAWVAATLLIGALCIVTVAALFWALVGSRTPRKLQDCLGSVMAIGMVWILIGQVSVISGQGSGNANEETLGWMIMGAAVSWIVWMWRTRPVLLAVGEQTGAGPAQAQLYPRSRQQHEPTTLSRVRERSRGFSIALKAAAVAVLFLMLQVGWMAVSRAAKRLRGPGPPHLAAAFLSAVSVWTGLVLVHRTTRWARAVGVVCFIVAGMTWLLPRLWTR